MLAQFNNDSRWYRARVLTFEVNEEDPLQSQVEVMYVDYGNSEIIPLSRSVCSEMCFIMNHATVNV